MSLLKINDLYKAYGDNIVLDGVSLVLHRGEKMGLVGPNGSGKSTLLKIIAGEEEADKGNIFLSKGATFGYLEQSSRVLTEEVITLENYLKGAVRDILSLREELRALEEAMAQAGKKEDADSVESLVKRYGYLSQLFESKSGYALESRLRAAAYGMGFQEEDLKRTVDKLSGGEKTRARLAALLLKEPELLLLDEPTNYLDLEALEWLETYLRNWSGTLLVVSHDRYFLDRVVNRMASLERGKIKTYRGNYSAYAAQRELEKATLKKAYEKQQAAVQKDLAFIRTASADERTKRQAHSREKRLRKMEQLSPPSGEKSFHLKFNFSEGSAKFALFCENVSKAFGDNLLFAGATFKIGWGERVALVGPNGAGKSTLLRLITGEEKPTSGQIILAKGARIAYFDQEQKLLDLNSTPLDTIMEGFGLSEAQARRHLGRFLFKGDEVFSPIRDLSGGEKSRLALAKVALEEGNFLIMDEPTNHLDIKGVEELEAALLEYPGTLLVVSHDRYFLSRLVNKVLVIKGGRVEAFNGSYGEYEKFRGACGEKGSLLKPDEGGSPGRKRKEEEKEKKERLILLRREKRRIEKLLWEIEEKIGQEEEKVNLLQEKLSSPEIYEDFPQARLLAEEYNAARRRLDELYEQWEKAASDLEDFQLPL